MFRELSLLQVYDSSENDLIQDLQVPLLQHSVDYLRGVGFFTSGWLRLASRGMAALVMRGGKARIVVSPILEKSDWDAIQAGEKARSDEALMLILTKRIKDLRDSLEEDTLNSLAWMVADGVLDFRFAVPRKLNYPGNYHDKVAVFLDDSGDSVAIHGSLNDSIQGSLNGEAFSVFRSWDPGQKPYLEQHKLRLENLWNDNNRQFKVCKIPDAIRTSIIQLRNTDTRPYSLPNPFFVRERPRVPVCPLTLYPFQDEAIKKWNEANCHGIFEMATGTGKTATSLSAAVGKYKELGKLSLIILVPYLHLLEQWSRNCYNFGFSPILCSSNNSNWQVEVKSRIQDYNLGALSNICIIAVHATAATDGFQNAINRLKPNTTMLIGDEVHGLGSHKLRNALSNRANLRLGLSATPRRWFDDEGTAAIFKYFGKTCFEYTLEQAIGKYLTPYRYFPQLVSLTDNETAEYEDLTQKIIKLYNSDSKSTETQEKLKKMLIRRAKIISSAQEKLPTLLHSLQNLIKDRHQAYKDVRDILIYCAPGRHREVLEAVSGIGLKSAEFVYDVSLSQREALLKQFANGDIQALVAIKCLDEGVDIPSTRIAFILASSTNPREFVQRRGRILRQHAEKAEAIIYDYIVVPPPHLISLKREVDISILKREMPRFAEFASSALNEFQARSSVRDILDSYNMLNLLDERPWDIYHSLKQWDWENDE